MSSVPFAICALFSHTSAKEKQITTLGFQKIFTRENLAQKSNFPFSRFHTSYIALYSTNNVCLVCTIIRGFRQVRSINFASDHVASMSDFFFLSRLRSFFPEKGSAFPPKIFRKRGAKNKAKKQRNALSFLLAKEKRADFSNLYFVPLKKNFVP